MIDISTPQTLAGYLAATGLAKDARAVTVKYFDSGVSCTVALATEGENQLLVKQALAKLKVRADWRCDPRRILVEKDANETYHQIVPDHAPEVLYYDAQNHIFARRAVPEDYTMWKSELLGGVLNYNLASGVIGALSQVHSRTAKTPETARRFADKSFFVDLRIDAYLRTTAAAHPAHAKVIDELARALLDTSVSLVHGDFSPKNILVKGASFYVLDFEVGHCGHPAFDVAFFANHFLLKAVKNKPWAGGYLDMLEFMLGKYFAAVDFMDAASLERTMTLLLGALFLARVDGKSPVEYLTDPDDKELVRKAAGIILREKPARHRDLVEIIKEEINRCPQK